MERSIFRILQNLRLSTYHVAHSLPQTRISITPQVLHSNLKLYFDTSTEAAAPRLTRPCVQLAGRLLRRPRPCHQARDAISLVAGINASIIQGSVVGPPSYVIVASDLHP